jgi:predicted transcriptional regulator
MKPEKEPLYKRYFSVRLDAATCKKLTKLAKTKRSQNQVFVDAINVLYDAETNTSKPIKTL